MKFKKKEDQCVDALVLLRRGNKIFTGANTESKCRDWRKGHPETAPAGDPLHIQSPNPDTIVDAKRCLLTRAWYSCLLRGSTRAWQIQRKMLTANHWPDHGVPNRGVRERTEGSEDFCNPIGRITISTTRPPPPRELLGTKPPTKEYIWRNPRLQPHM